MEDALLAEWKISRPSVVKDSEAVMAASRKAWRWIGEMDEIAGSFEAAGLPGGFHFAAAEIYGRLEGFKEAPEPPVMADILNAVAKGA